MDKGIKFILETCRAMFNFAMKRRHLSPYAENPFSVIDLDRISVEHRRPIVVFSADEERQFFQQCDDWQFPIQLPICHPMLARRPSSTVSRWLDQSKIL